MRRSPGLTLLEVLMALTVSIMIAAGSVYAYRQHMYAVRITQAKLMLQGIRQGIEMQRYRTGSFPTTADIFLNQDDRGQPYFGAAGTRLRDPIHPPRNASEGSPVKSGLTPGTPWGGWVYDSSNGVIRPNLDDNDYPSDPPSKW